jgi:hypothetical protein
MDNLESSGHPAPHQWCPSLAPSFLQLMEREGDEVKVRELNLEHGNHRHFFARKQATIIDHRDLFNVSSRSYDSIRRNEGI